MLLHHKNPSPFFHYRSTHIYGLLIVDLIVSQEYARKKGWVSNTCGGVFVDEKPYYEGCSHGRFGRLYFEMAGTTISVATLLQKHDKAEKRMISVCLDPEIQDREKGDHKGDDRVSIQSDASTVVTEVLNPMNVGSRSSSRNSFSANAHTGTIRNESKVIEKKRRFLWMLGGREHQQEELNEQEKVRDRKELSKKLNMQFI